MPSGTIWYAAPDPKRRCFAFHQEPRYAFQFGSKELAEEFRMEVHRSDPTKQKSLSTMLEAVEVEITA
jgi:hypothetical protein